MRYFTTRLEDTVENLYKSLGIKDPNYDIASIADDLGIVVSYFKLPFALPGYISISPWLTKEQQKETFAHELNHALFDAGLQIDMPESFRLYQEYKARNFALHFCIPTFMLRRLDLSNHRSWNIHLIAETFGVTKSFADQRLDHYERQIAGSLYHERVLKLT